MYSIETEIYKKEGYKKMTANNYSNKNEMVGNEGIEKLITISNNLRKQGIYTFPVFRNKYPNLNGSWKDLSTTHDPTTLIYYDSLKPEKISGLGVYTGASNLLVIDLDIPHEPLQDTKNGMQYFAELMNDNNIQLPPTLTIKTQRGGRHLYFKYDKDDISPSVAKLGHYIDIRANVSYTVIYNIEGDYQVLPYQSTGEVLDLATDNIIDYIAPLPDDLRNLILQKYEADRQNKVISLPTAQTNTEPEAVQSNKYLQKVIDSLLSTPIGQRNNELYNAAFKTYSLIATNQVSEQDATDQLVNAAVTIGLSASESLRTIQSAFNGAKEVGIIDSVKKYVNQKPNKKDHLPMRTILTMFYDWLERQDTIKWNVDDKKFFIYDNTYGVWYGISNTIIIDYFYNFATELFKDADDYIYNATYEWIMSRSPSAIKNDLMTQSHRLERLKSTIAIDNSRLDNEPDYICVNNGVIDLKTGELLPHDKKYYFTKWIELDYNPDNQLHDLFDRFLNSIFLNDKETIDYVQRLFGYSMTGHTSEQKLHIFFGTGRNGKSVLNDTMLQVFGSYAGFVSNDILTTTRNTTSNYSLPMLDGMRLAFTNEAQGSLNESVVKQLTGDRQIEVRKLYGNPYKMTVKTKLIMVTNHRPSIYNPSNSIYRRIVLIPFNLQISEKDQNIHLLDQLTQKNVLETILTWVVKGAVKWYKEGLLKKSKMLIQETLIFQDDTDTYGDFFNQIQVTNKRTDYITIKDLYDYYLQWAEGYNISSDKVLTIKKLSKIVRERLGLVKVAKKIDGKTYKVFVGARLKSQLEIMLDDAEKDNNMHKLGFYDTTEYTDVDTSKTPEVANTNIQETDIYQSMFDDAPEILNPDFARQNSIVAQRNLSKDKPEFTMHVDDGFMEQQRYAVHRDIIDIDNKYIDTDYKAGDNIITIDVAVLDAVLDEIESNINNQYPVYDFSGLN